MTVVRIGSFSLKDLSEDDLKILQADAQYATATGMPRKWTVVFDPQGKPSLMRVWASPRV